MSREIEKLKEAILKEYPRLSLDSEFSFKCHKDVPCFNACCGDVNIFLTPYDVIRLKNHLGITSGEFLSKYTLSPFDEHTKYPVILLKMEDNEKKSCPFVGEQGCTVYEDRPWPCRMYPLGMASPKDDPQNIQEGFYFVLKEDVCQGHQEDNKYTVGEWLDDQGINDYNEIGELFKDITLHDFFQKGGQLEPQKMDMFFTACYNLDRFRDFIFQSTFMEKFEVDEETQALIKADDVELLKFGYRWIRFAFFGEDTIRIKADVREAKKKKLKEKDKESPS
jgi:Fe-S-cluster containining protein